MSAPGGTPLYEYGHHDGSGYHGLPEVPLFRPAPDTEQQAALRQPLNGLDEVNYTWDPAEELAYLLQEARGTRPAEPLGPIGPDETGDTVAAAGLATGLTQAVYGGPRPETPHHGHRRVAAKAPRAPRAPILTLFRTGSLFSALLVALIAAVVSVFSGLAISDALRQTAGPRTAHDIVIWWPLLICGPWMVASLSILRAALHQRRAIHSWSIVLLFSTLATLLCVAQAPRTFAAQAAATLPPSRRWPASSSSSARSPSHDRPATPPRVTGSAPGRPPRCGPLPRRAARVLRFPTTRWRITRPAAVPPRLPVPLRIVRQSAARPARARRREGAAHGGRASPASRTSVLPRIPTIMITAISATKTSSDRSRAAHGLSPTGLPRAAAATPLAPVHRERTAS